MASGNDPLVHLYSEDASADAFPVLVALTKKALREVEPALPTQRVGFEPSAPARRAALTANRWWGGDKVGRAALVDLARDMATQLARGPREGRLSVVLYHMDGDVPWSRRGDGRNVPRFEVLREAVRRIVPDPALVRGLVLVAPHYSIEAWTYQNVTVLRACVESDARTLDAARRALLDLWEADPAALDDHDRPKEAFTDRWNLKLSERAWPVDRARRAEASFVAFVAALGEVPALRETLGSLASAPYSP